jgi:hypothetical protein
MDLSVTHGSKIKIDILFYKYVVISCILSIIFDFDKSMGILYYVGFILSCGTLMSVFIFPLKKLLLPLLIILIVAKDTTQGSAEVDSLGIIVSGTPWQIYIGKISPAFLIIIPVFVIFIRLYTLEKLKWDLLLPIYLFVVSIVVSLIYGFPKQDFGRFFTDLKIPIFFCFGLGIFNLYFLRYPKSLPHITKIILALMVGRITIDFLYLITNYGQRLSTYNYLSVDSTKGIVIVLIFLFFAKLIHGKQIISNLIFLGLSISVLIAYQTKWLILVAILGAIILFFSLNTRHKAKIILVLFFTGAILIPLLGFFFPVAFELIGFRFSNITTINANTTIDQVDLVRTASFVNSVNTLLDKNAIFTGLGYGSWYTDNYFPMLNLNTSSFEEESLQTNRYYRVHDFFFMFLFKFGVIGLFLFIRVYVKPLLKIFKSRAFFYKTENLSILFIILIGCSPMFITSMYWTGKGLMVISLFVIISKRWSLEATKETNGS